MLLAADRLAAADESVAAIASALGYESESSFGKAFRRVIGQAPRRFARARVTAAE
jgi:AraC-like DNA-binding protein